MRDFFVSLIDTLVALFRDSVQFVLDQVDALARLVWAGIVDALVGLIAAIPWPAWLGQVGTVQLSCEVMWAIAPFDLPFGGMVVGGAMLVRFLIRRLPVVG